MPGHTICTGKHRNGKTKKIISHSQLYAEGRSPTIGERPSSFTFPRQEACSILRAKGSPSWAPYFYPITNQEFRIAIIHDEWGFCHSHPMKVP